MNIEFLTILISAIVTLTTTIIGYYAGKRGERKKVEAEAEHSELGNVQEAIKIWKDIATDLKAQMAELETKIDNLEKTIEELKPFKDENKQLQKTINILRQQIKNTEK